MAMRLCQSTCRRANKKLFEIRRYLLVGFPYFVIFQKWPVWVRKAFPTLWIVCYNLKKRQWWSGLSYHSVQYNQLMGTIRKTNDVDKQSTFYSCKYNLEGKSHSLQLFSHLHDNLTTTPESWTQEKEKTYSVMLRMTFWTWMLNMQTDL